MVIYEQLGYEPVRLIAEGGMGLVYEAVQKGAGGFHKEVAIKIIREEFSAIAEFRKNFVGEAKLVADLIHTNIVQMYHLGKLEERYFMVMEYVDGVSLEDFFVEHLEQDRYLPIDLAVFIISRICRGLAYAHQKRDKRGQPLGIVHRDVNPKNIMLSYEGDVKLMDFGIAKALNLMYNDEGVVIAGKDEYLSPEQARREVTDHRADLFSCGLLLSELLLGYHFFEEADGEKTRNNILQMKLPNFSQLRPEIDKKLNAIIHKSLQRPREKRYQSAEEMLMALEIYLYKDGYGPTNEKLSSYIRQVYSSKPQARGSTSSPDRTAAILA